MTPHGPRSSTPRLGLFAILAALGGLFLAPGLAHAIAAAGGTVGALVVSTNSGSSWSVTNPSNLQTVIRGIWMIDESRGFAVMNGSLIYRTANAWGTRDSVTAPVQGVFEDVVFADANTGWIAVSAGGALKTTNGGTTWISQTNGINGPCEAVWATSTTRAWMVGIGGLVHRTTNGGTSWSFSTVPSPVDLHDVFFVDDNTGWAVGNSGRIYKSTNGGSTWTQQTTPGSISSSSLNGIWMTSATTGWVVGDANILLKTTNGGTNWTLQSGLPTPSTLLMAVSFAGADSGIVVGSGYSAMRTVNGGTTWTASSPDPDNGTLMCVHLPRPVPPPPDITITVASSPTGRSFTFDGANHTAPQTFTFPSGELHTLSLTTTQNGTTGTRYVFDDWSTGETSATITIQPTGNQTITARFDTQYRLTMTSVANGTTSPAEGGTHWFNAGSAVQITGTGAAGYQFDAWAGSGTGSYTGGNNPANITMSGPITETASFEPRQIALSFATSPSGRQVRVDGTLRTTPYTLNTTADLSHSIECPEPQDATATSRRMFQSWSDGGARSHTIDPLVNTTYTATLKTQYFLDMTVDPGPTSGTVSPGDTWHDAGAVVSITATANPGWFHFYWNGTGTGSFSGLPGSRQVTMSNAVTETANFGQTPVQVTVRTNPPGRAFSILGVGYSATQTFSWPSGMPFQVSTTTPQTLADQTKRWRFSSWSDGGAQNHTVTPTGGPKTYQCNFVTQFPLVMTAGTGGTTTPPPGTSWHDTTTVLSIEATPDPTYAFNLWTGTGANSYTGSNDSAGVKMNNRITQGATFNAVPSITVTDPVAGERFIATRPETIRWSSAHLPTNVRIHYKLGVNGTLIPITLTTLNDGEYVWTPPDQPSGLYRIRVADVLDGNPVDDSDAFTICDPLFNAGPPASFLNGNASDGVAADFNENGVQDVAFATGSGIRFRLGLGAGGVGDGGFASFVTINLVAVTNALAVLDFNDDDRLDMVAALADGRIALVRGNGTGAVGNGTFTVVQPFLTVGTSLTDVEPGDWNEDGITDLIVADSGGNRLFFLAGGGANGTANGTFATPVEIPLAFSPRSVKSHDLDEDGILDLVVSISGSATADLLVLRGLGGGAIGNGTFAAPTTILMAGDLDDLAIADFNKDGRADVAALRSDASIGYVFAGQGTGPVGNGTLALLGSFATGANPASMVMADFNRDGRADLATGALDGTLLVSAGLANGLFAPLDSLTSFMNATALVVEDMLEDNRSDLMVVTQTGVTYVHTGDFAMCASSAATTSVLAPNAGGNFNIGQEMAIQWIAGSAVQTVDVQLSRDNGARWETIARDVTENAFSWTVTPPAAPTCLLRVLDSGLSSRVDTCDVAFAISAGAVAVDPPGMGGVPAVAALSAAWPNPAHTEARLRLAVPRPAEASLLVYDAVGRRVRTLVDGPLEPGEHVVVWDGRSDAGDRVPPGVYFLRGRWGGFQADRRVVLIR